MQINDAMGMTRVAPPQGERVQDALARLRFADSAVRSAANCWEEYAEELDSYLERCEVRDGAALGAAIDLRSGRPERGQGVHVFACLSDGDREPAFYLCVPGARLEDSRFAVAIVDFDNKEEGCQVYVSPLMDWSAFQAEYLRDHC